MPHEEKEDKDPFLARSLKALQDTTTSAGPAAAASYTLVGAVILLGAVGYGLDRWWRSSPPTSPGGSSAAPRASGRRACRRCCCRRSPRRCCSTPPTPS